METSSNVGVWSPQTKLSLDSQGVAVQVKKGCEEATFIIWRVEPEDMVGWWTVYTCSIAGWRLPQNGFRVGDLLGGWEVVSITLYPPYAQPR